ncbi:NAD(+) diphosphatase [Sphingomonas sp. LY160]|uniref:NAD(+) diphosphatase n=1 Tax=Sphingomonas sp. LY160 TaxID=3095342 RepID=UPI002ADEF571|nr:NAD(+) diphosphatase [Sphingomonas sp. LY160]MEA1072106.1 NAD(+) diphosphatase [Sphingomonas sp. LY160]
MRPDPFFAGPGLDRADHLRGDPDAIRALARRSDARCLHWTDGAPSLDDKGSLRWEPFEGEAPLFLGLDGVAPRFSTLPPLEVAEHARSHFGLLSLLHAADAPTFAAALSLANWHRRHGHCSVCGSTTAPNRGGWSRACPACGAEHYPRADPVVIMLASHRDRLLLGRQPAYPPGRYSALAGFVEPGETIEAAVARELKEEAGIAVRDVTYVASQPWPFPSSLMIGAHAIADDDRLTIDTNELDDARWFTREEVEAAMSGAPDPAFLPPPPAAIAHTLLAWWLDA